MLQVISPLLISSMNNYVMLFYHMQKWWKLTQVFSCPVTVLFVTGDLQHI